MTADAGSGAHAPGPAAARLPGGAMLQPAMVLAVGVLVVNDHWLKARLGAGPGVGVVTGKLSDVAGLAFFPALLVSMAEVVRWVVRGGGDSWACTRREVVAAAVATAACFAAAKSLPVAGGGYEMGLAALRWCPAAVAAALTGGPSPPVPQVSHVMDLTDNLCLPAVWAGYRAGCRVGCRERACAMTTGGAAADGR